MLHLTKYDASTDGAHGIGRPDPYTDGARDVRAPRDPYSEGARDIKGVRDPFTDGARAGNGQIAGTTRTGSSAAPGNTLEQADFAA